MSEHKHGRSTGLRVPPEPRVSGRSRLALGFALLALAAGALCLPSCSGGDDHGIDALDGVEGGEWYWLKCSPSEACGGGHSCIDDRCTTKCTSSASCTSGDYKDTSTCVASSGGELNVCAPSCELDGTCPEGCAKDGCPGDDDPDVVDGPDTSDTSSPDTSDTSSPDDTSETSSEDTAACTTNCPWFRDSGQALGDMHTYGVALGDLDGDGDLDAVFADDFDYAGHVFLNDGGVLSDSGQALGQGLLYEWGRDVALVDIDGDDDLDILIAVSSATTSGGTPFRLHVNDGSGVFEASGQNIGTPSDQVARAIALGDVDGDGDLDMVAAMSQANFVFLNDGGTFTDSGQTLGSDNNTDVELADVDGDDDLDAVFTNFDGPNRLYLNDGGIFTDSGQELGDTSSGTGKAWDVALGDVDGDGDPDAFIVYDLSGPHFVYLNNGGTFTDSGQVLGEWASGAVVLEDVDGDGDLDAIVNGLGNVPGNRIYLNDGGIFTDSGLELGTSDTYCLAVGDLDGDGDPDVVYGNDGANTVYFNEWGE